MRADVASLEAMGFDVFPAFGLGSPRVKQPKTKGRDWRDGPPPGGWDWAADDLIGVNLPVGTVVVDIDDADKFRESGLNLTRSVFTGTRREGGLHVFYRAEAPVDQVTEGQTLGYDTRVGGLGYVIAWEPGKWKPVSEWGPAPQWVYEHRKREMAERDPEAPMGTREDILSFLGKFPARGLALSKDAYYSILTTERQTGRLVALDPKRPWTDEDLRELAAQAAKWDVAPPEPQLILSTPKPEPVLNVAAAKEQASHGTILNIVDYLRNVPREVPWIVEHVAFQHGVTLITGTPKAGKSTFAFDIMRLREEAGDFLGFYCAKGPTLLVTEEGGVPIRFKGGNLENLDVYDRKASAGESFLDTLNVIGEWADQHERGVVFIDTLAAWAQVKDENDSAEMTKAIDNVRLLAESCDIAVILIHHARKAKGEYGEAVRGSGAILASVDHVLEITRPSETHPTRRRVSVMSRVLHSQESWLIDWDPMTARYAVLDEAELGEIAKEEDLGTFADQFPRIGGITRAEARERGVGETRLRRLVNKGMLRAIPTKGAATLYIDIRVPLTRSDDADATAE